MCKLLAFEGSVCVIAYAGSSAACTGIAYPVGELVCRIRRRKIQLC